MWVPSFENFQKAAHNQHVVEEDLMLKYVSAPVFALALVIAGIAPAWGEPAPAASSAPTEHPGKSFI